MTSDPHLPSGSSVMTMSASPNTDAMAFMDSLALNPSSRSNSGPASQNEPSLFEPTIRPDPTRLPATGRQPHMKSIQWHRGFSNPIRPRALASIMSALPSESVQGPGANASADVFQSDSWGRGHPNKPSLPVPAIQPGPTRLPAAGRQPHVNSTRRQREVSNPIWPRTLASIMSALPSESVQGPGANASADVFQSDSWGRGHPNKPSLPVSTIQPAPTPPSAVLLGANGLPSGGRSDQWKEAIDLQKSMLEKYILELGQHHTDTASVSKSLASTYNSIGRWSDAKRLQSTLLNHQKEALGISHAETMSTMHDLALTFSCLGRWEDAEKMQESVVAGRREALGELHPDTLLAKHNLALVYSGQGRWKEAQQLHEQVLQARIQVLGEQHVDTLSSMHSLATKHRESGQSIVDAEELNKKVLELRQEALGPQHPDTLSSMYALALVYRRRGQWGTAVEMMGTVHETQKKVLGRDHVQTIQTMRSLASWYSNSGSLPNASGLYMDILESRKAVYGTDSPETLASMNKLVSTYWKQGLWARAESLHIELLEARRHVLGDDDTSCIATALDLATHYLNQCRWLDASLIFKEVLATRRQHQEPHDSNSEIANIQQQLDLTLFALSLDVFIISSSVPIESVVAYFTGKARLKDYTTLLEELPNPPKEPMAWGGFSNIYKITLQDGRELAVKCLKSVDGGDKQVKRTVRELSAWSQLRHKSIAALLGLALFQGQIAMVSTWNKNGNVMKHIGERPEVDRYALCIQVVSAVVYLHRFDIVHGDLKGANILVTDDGSLQLTDFGLTIIHGAMVQFSKSAGQVGGGTLRWMAPELVFGNEASQDSGNASRSMSEALTMAKESDVNNDAQPKLCKATDIYALGMTMLEILTGKRPFKELDKDVAVILALDKGNRPRRPKRILEQSPRGALFWDILQKCWAQTPEDRPAANVVDTLILSLCSG